jgi:short-subunit dehydrogenase
LITGASAGFGAEFALQLARDAEVMVLTARRMDRLEALERKVLQLNPKLRVERVTADLSQPEGHRAVVDFLLEKKIEVDFLINNAGLGDLGTFESSDWKRVREMVMVNMVALTALTHALLPWMIARKNGAILQVASTAGFHPLPTFAVYAATKAYVCSLSEALRVEVRGKGVTVTALCPGPVETEFGQVASRANSRRAFGPPRLLYVPVQKVVARALAGVYAGRARVVPGWHVRLGACIWELIPIWIMRPFMRMSQSMMEKPE